jgi:DNA-binding MarR family transcriptional regulator
MGGDPSGAYAGAVLIRAAELQAIRAGRVDLAFRRWDRPRLRVGTRMRTAIGLVEVTSVDELAAEAISDDDARRAGARSRDELLAGLARHAERPVFRIGLRFAGPDPRVALRERADLAEDERARLVLRLERLDRASRHGPWTRATLAAIARRPGTRATDLAHGLGRETPAFKRDVRKLKELGLTESLDTGYRLSPRGRALVRTSALPEAARARRSS